MRLRLNGIERISGQTAASLLNVFFGLRCVLLVLRAGSLASDWRGGMAKTVLIVEDNELNMKLFRDLLEAHGYQTSGTSNGFEALDLVRKLRPDLILMDIQLPQVSGLEVTRWIKDDPELRSIPVVAVTAFAMKGDEERIREGGCEAYLSKPISVGKFIETIRHFLGSPQLPPAFLSSTTYLPTSNCSKRGCRRNISTSSPP